MVLFVFAIMLLNLGTQTPQQASAWLSPAAWTGPALLTLVLFGELAYILFSGANGPAAARLVGPEEVGIALFGPYLLAVEMAALLLLAGLIGAYHLGRRVRRRPGPQREEI
jgi:NADH-quinone oxidoreductase subunit J